jgi:AcrR family transcriptional regulator
VTRARSDDQRKQQIREAATRCFVRRGYAATRLLDIAREAGLSKGGVYFHYRAKEQLFHEILENYVRVLQDRWDFEPVADQPADRTMGRLVIVHLRSVQDDPDEIRLFNLLVTMAAQEQAFRERLEELFRVMRGLYANVIERGIVEGVFMSGDPQHLAVSVLSYLNGLGGFTAIHEDGTLPISPEHGAEQVLRMLKSHSTVSSVEFASPAAHPNKPQPN